MDRVKVATAGALVVIAVAIGLTLTQSPIAVSAVNTPQQTVIALVDRPMTVCQLGETLPRGTTGVRLRMPSVNGPRVTAELSVNGRLIAHGEHESGTTGAVVTIPVGPLPVAYSGVKLCFHLFLNGDETIAFVGAPAHMASVAGSSVQVPRRVRVEYLHPGSSSWWSLTTQVARRMGLGHAPSGTWVALFVLLSMIAVLALCSRLILRELS